MPSEGGASAGQANFLSNFYAGLEEGYYGAMDSLQSAGANVYGLFVEPIERTGIPSFPVFVLLLLAIIGGAIYFLNPAGILGQQTSLQVNVLASGAPVAGAQVQLTINGQAAQTQTTGPDGSVHFDKVPAGSSAIVSVSKDGFAPLEQDVVIGQEKSFDAQLQAQATPVPPAVPSVGVLFEDIDTKKPISGVKVVYQGPVSGLNQTYTQDDGSATLQFSDSAVRIFATNPYYQALSDTVNAGAGTVTFYMKSIESQPSNGTCTGDTCPPQLASVSVSIFDEQGNPVEGKVELYTVGSLAAPQLAEAVNGVASFPSSTAVGNSVYAKAYPTASSTYANGESDQKAVPADGLDLAVTVKKKAALPQGSVKTISLTIVDEAGNPISGATAYLFLGTKADPITTNYTDSDGNAAFDVDSSQTFTVIAYAGGYLPSGEYSIAPSQTSQQIVLKRAVVGSYGNVNVTVEDPDGNGVVGASVVLRNEQDSLPVGLPQEQTDETYAAYFTPVPLSNPVKVSATYGSMKGESAGFAVQAGIDSNVVVQLQRPTGTIAVLARDPFSGAAIANALITAADEVKGQGASCTTDASGACSMQKVPAAVPVDVSFGANGYLNYTARGLVVPPGDSISVNLSSGLVPTYLANQTRLAVGLYKQDCSGNSIAPGSLIAKARSYCVRLDFNIPNASDPTGFLFRVGGAGDVASSNGAISAFQDYGSLNLSLYNLAITSSQSYVPGSCAASTAVQAQQWKWINYEFNGVQGSKTVFLQVFVQPNATENSNLDLNYFSYAVKGGQYFRVPFDPVLGSARTAGGEDYCDGQTNTTAYRIASGNIVYNANAGLALGFAPDAASPAAPSLHTTSGTSFAVKFTAEYFSQLSNPVLKLFSTDPLGNQRNFISFNSYTLYSGGVIAPSTPLGGTSSESISFNPASVINVGGAYQLNGTVNATALIPISLSKVRLELWDGGNLIANVSASATITGTAQLTVNLIPSVPLTANADNSLTALVTTSGSPVSDTIVPIVSLDGFPNPFGPQYADGDIEVVGDGSSGKGQNGKYAFNPLHPVRYGQFAFDVGGSRDPRFAETIQPVRVQQNDFIQAFPSSVALGCAPDTLQVQNTLSFAPAVVNVSFSQSTPCAQVQSSAGVQCIQTTQGYCSKWQVSLAASGGKTLTLTPLRSGECTLALSSSIDPLTSFYQAVPTTVECTQLNPACTVTATPGSVFGGAGQLGANQTLLTVQLSNPPVANGLVAQFGCGDVVGLNSTLSSVQFSGSSAIASATCAYSPVGALTTRTATVTILDSNQNPLSPPLSCSGNVLVAPLPGGPASCQVSSTPAQGTSAVHLTATFFNLRPTDSQAAFVCDENDPSSAFGQAALTYDANSRTSTASFDCDYTGKAGGLFNASAAAGAAFCYNASTRILPPGPGCTFGSGSSAESLRFGECSQAAPSIICGGVPSAPSMQLDRTGTCCQLELGSTYVLDNASAPIPFCRNTAQAPGPNTCSDGVTVAGTCRTISVNSIERATPLYCNSGANWVSNSSCCSAVPGFGYDAATGQCAPQQINACTITAGSVSESVSYGNCTTAPVGLRCSGASGSPGLVGDNACCQLAIGPSYSWSGGNNSCVNPTTPVGPNNCDPYTAVGQCQQRDPNNPHWIPSPQKCFNNGNGPQWFFGRSECCPDYNNTVYAMSDDGKLCVPVPPSQVTPACNANELSFAAANGSVYAASYNASAIRLQNFFGGQVQFSFTCDDAVQQVQSSTAAIGNTPQQSISFGCDYAKGFFNSTVQPRVRAIITSPVSGGQTTVDCSLNGTDITGSGQIIIPGSNTQPGFNVEMQLSGQNFSTITPPPLGPLQQLTAVVNLSTMPAGITPDDLQVFVQCDSNTPKVQAAYNSVDQNEWDASCSYSSPQTNHNWPVLHHPAAFYQLTIGSQAFPLARVPPSFYPVAEYAQPVAGGISVTDLKDPTLADENLSLQLDAPFHGLPSTLGPQSLLLSCQGEVPGPVAVSVPVNGSASVSRICNYTSTATAASDYLYSAAIAGSLANADAHSEIAVNYAPGVPKAFCTWLNLPTEIVVGSPGQDSFQPQVLVSGLSAPPSKVLFDCGNGQKIAASSIVQNGTNGQEVDSIATSSSSCQYPFSFLAGQSSQVIQLDAFADGVECGPQTLAANSVALGSTRALLGNPQAIDDAMLGDQVQVNITVVNPPDGFDQLNPTAVFDCGRGSTPAGAPQQIPMEAQPAFSGNGTIFFAQAVCSYNDVLVPTIRTISGLVKASPPYGRLVTIPPQVSFTQQPLITNSSNNITNGNSTSNVSQVFQECGGFGLMAALAPLLAQPFIGPQLGGVGPNGQPNQISSIPSIHPPAAYDVATDKALLNAAAETAIKGYKGRGIVAYFDANGKLQLYPSTLNLIIKYAKPITAAVSPPIVILYAGTAGIYGGNSTTQLPPIQVNIDPQPTNGCLTVKAMAKGTGGTLNLNPGEYGAYRVSTDDAAACAGSSDSQNSNLFTFNLKAGNGAAVAAGQVTIEVEEFPAPGNVASLYGAVFSPATYGQSGQVGSTVPITIAYRMDDVKDSASTPVIPEDIAQPKQGQGGYFDPTQIAWNVQNSNGQITSGSIAPIAIKGSSDTQTGVARVYAHAGATIQVLKDGTQPGTASSPTWSWQSTADNSKKIAWNDKGGLKLLGDYDIIGAKGGDTTQGIFACSGNNFCTRDQVNTVKTKITTDLTTELAQYRKNIEQNIDAAGFTQALGPQLFQAIEDTKSQINQRISQYNQQAQAQMAQQYASRDAAIRAAQMQYQQQPYSSLGGYGGYPGQGYGFGYPGYGGYGGLGGMGGYPYGSYGGYGGLGGYGFPGGYGGYGGMGGYGAGGAYGAPYGPFGQGGFPLGAGYPPFTGSQFSGANGQQVIDGCIGVATCAAIMASMFNSQMMMQARMGNGPGSFGGTITQMMRLGAIPFCTSDDVQRSIANGTGGSGLFTSAFLGSALSGMFLSALPHGNAGLGGQNQQPPPPSQSNPATPSASVPSMGDVPLINVPNNFYTQQALGVPTIRITLPIRADIHYEGQTTVASGLQALQFDVQVSKNQVVPRNDLYLAPWGSGTAASGASKALTGYPYQYADHAGLNSANAQAAKPSGVFYDQGTPNLWTMNKYDALKDKLTAAKAEGDSACHLKWDDQTGTSIDPKFGLDAAGNAKELLPDCQLAAKFVNDNLAKTVCQPTRACAFVALVPTSGAMSQDEKKYNVISATVAAKKFYVKTGAQWGWQVQNQVEGWECVNSNLLKGATATSIPLESLREDVVNFFLDESYTPSSLIALDKQATVVLGTGSDGGTKTPPQAPEASQCNTVVPVAGQPADPAGEAEQLSQCYTTLRLDPQKDTDYQLAMVACDAGAAQSP